MFKTMTSAITKQKVQEEDIQKISPWIFCRWLAGSPLTIHAANKLNSYDKIPIENQYYMVKSAFAGKIKYIPYPKNIKEETTNELNCLMEYFNVNLDKAKEYLNLIDKDELEMIVSLYESKR